MMRVGWLNPHFTSFKMLLLFFTQDDGCNETVFANNEKEKQSRQLKCAFGDPG